ncbi:hypothetical protein [Listeria aquatica]
MDTNPNEAFGTAIIMLGICVETFAGMFNADGTAQLKVNPDAGLRMQGA